MNAVPAHLVSAGRQFRGLAMHSFSPSLTSPLVNPQVAHKPRKPCKTAEPRRERRGRFTMVRIETQNCPLDPPVIMLDLCSPSISNSEEITAQSPLPGSAPRLVTAQDADLSRGSFPSGQRPEAVWDECAAAIQTSMHRNLREYAKLRTDFERLAQQLNIPVSEQWLRGLRDTVAAECTNVRNTHQKLEERARLAAGGYEFSELFTEDAVVVRSPAYLDEGLSDLQKHLTRQLMELTIRLDSSLHGALVMPEYDEPEPSHSLKQRCKANRGRGDAAGQSLRDTTTGEPGSLGDESGCWLCGELNCSCEEALDTDTTDSTTTAVSYEPESASRTTSTNDPMSSNDTNSLGTNKTHRTDQLMPADWIDLDGMDWVDVNEDEILNTWTKDIDKYVTINKING